MPMDVSDVIGTERLRSCSSVAKRAGDSKLLARMTAGAAALCSHMLKLTQVSSPARTRLHSVLLCGLAP